ncbi:orotate phosphoribosyltransferase [Oceanobacillus halotolerans]|uniref:orotate phosphoribosyltransferase n=1 Tax=Oceanobacillus halotolerans TaxID=2663380 RepID=UPI0013DB48D1|nr:orotate phosphoribosyltransferase [Oceanobacillus halotolerans]
MIQSKEIARDLLAIHAIQIDTKHYFTWTSGLQSPIYCDNRLTLSYPAIRKKIIDGFASFVMEMDMKPDIIVGCATAGIPHAAWLADQLNLPLAYVRSTPKGHGKQNQIEGVIKKGQKALVIEDLISTGGSSLGVAKALQREGVSVLGVFAIFTYGLNKADLHFQEAGIEYETLTNFDISVDLLEEDGSITTTEKEALISWRNELS